MDDASGVTCTAGGRGSVPALAEAAAGFRVRVKSSAH